MARRAAVALIVAVVAAIALPLRAAGLARLTVQSFVLAADTANPQVDVPFHLIVTLRVRERVNEVADLNLPILAELELLGDERETASTPRGTQYRETITVVAHRAGPISIAPATLQAIDARDRKAKQWFTNGLTLQVAAAAPQVLGDGARALGRAAVTLLWVLLALAGVAVVAVVVVLAARRPRRVYVAPMPPPPPPPPAPPPIARSRRDLIQDALVVLRAERSRPAAVRVRAAVWQMLGASDGETLGDVLRLDEALDEPTRSLLIALERSAFTYDDDLARAIDDACSALERYSGSLA